MRRSTRKKSGASSTPHTQQHTSHPQQTTPHPQQTAPHPQQLPSQRNLPDKLHLPQRYKGLGDLYILDEHVLVAKPHGKIYLVLRDYTKAAMEKLLEDTSIMTIPANRKESNEAGEAIVDGMPRIN